MNAQDEAVVDQNGIRGEDVENAEIGIEAKIDENGQREKDFGNNENRVEAEIDANGLGEQIDGNNEIGVEAYIDANGLEERDVENLGVGIETEINENDAGAEVASNENSVRAEGVDSDHRAGTDDVVHETKVDEQAATHENRVGEDNDYQHMQGEHEVLGGLDDDWPPTEDGKGLTYFVPVRYLDGSDDEELMSARNNFRKIGEDMRKRAAIDKSQEGEASGLSGDDEGDNGVRFEQGVEGEKV